MSDYDEIEKLREDEPGDSDAPDPAGGSRCVLARTKTKTTYPTSVGTNGVYIACETLLLTGAETEGGAGTVTPLGDTFYGFLPHSAASVPPSGTQVVCTFVSDRFVIEW